MNNSGTVRAALIQMASTDDVAENLKEASRRVSEAAGQGAQIVCLPEMFVCLYTNESFVRHQEKAGGRIYQALKGMAEENRVWLIGGSMPESDGGRLYNTCFVFDPDGREAGRHRKVHLFDIAVRGGQHFKESDTFTPGNDIITIETPFGRIGIEICFDIRFPEQTSLMAADGAQMVFVPASFNMTTGPAHWELLFRARAVDNQLYLFGCAPARDPGGPYVSYGNSIAVSPWGDVIARAGEDEEILFADVDLSLVNDIRSQLPVMSARRTDLYEVKKTSR